MFKRIVFSMLVVVFCYAATAQPISDYYDARVWVAFDAYEMQHPGLKRGKDYDEKKERAGGVQEKIWHHSQDVFINDSYKGDYSEYVEMNSVLNKKMLYQRDEYLMKQTTSYEEALAYYRELKKRTEQALKKEDKFNTGAETKTGAESGSAFGGFSDASSKRGDNLTISYLTGYKSGELKKRGRVTYAKSFEIKLISADDNYKVIAILGLDTVAP